MNDSATGLIGVIANPSEHAVVREFFELFKTPWEFYRGNREYTVLLCAGSGSFDLGAAKLVLVYSGERLPADPPRGCDAVGEQDGGRILSHDQLRIPIYGRVVTFPEESSFLVDEETHRCAAYIDRPGQRTFVRIGYDLFCEIRRLLTAGQPVSRADLPALDFHIALLRELIVTSGAPLVEIPPVPKGYRFIACLTHDVDHPSIRRHKLDHTIFGFLYRAVVRTFLEVLKGRTTARRLARNWTAAIKLPFVYLGLAKDFWQQFDRYPELERARSSFFVIPFKGRPGRKGAGQAPGRRASAYGAADIAAQIESLKSAGCEIGLHGLDAWTDSAAGREELDEIRRVTGAQELGVRMHWLFFDGESPVTLERAGADYDSTVGFNQTVGYRAGTTQVYKPLETTQLLELPLHIMDTSLFYPTHLGLSPKEAAKRVSRIIDHAVEFGGSVTVNWHDRSIAPERCWGEFYVEVVDELRRKGAWFATAGETVAWFRKRRAATFENGSESAILHNIENRKEGDRDLPAMNLRVANMPDHGDSALLLESQTLGRP